MPRLSTPTREVGAVAYGGECNSGFCRIYSGTRPATADTALAGNTLLAELPFGATAFPGGAVDGVVTSASISDASANASGTQTFARLVKADGTVVMDLSCGGPTGGPWEITLGSDSIVAGATVTVTAISITVPAGS